MHELGIVFHCIKQVKHVAQENNVKSVKTVTVELGEVSAVIPYLFEECWDWAVKKETILKDCKLKIETIKAVTHCEACGNDYPTVEHGKTCPYCKSDKTYLLTGNEMVIKEIAVENKNG